MGNDHHLNAILLESLKTHGGEEPFPFYVHSIHLQSWPVLCTTYKYMVEEMHRGYLQEPNNSLYTSKMKIYKKKREKHCCKC